MIIIELLRILMHLNGKWEKNQISKLVYLSKKRYDNGGLVFLGIIFIEKEGEK